MRFKIILAAILLAATHATAAAAQTVDSPVYAASAIAPLPASLVPDDVDERAAESASRISVRRVLVSTGVGALVGAGGGLILGTLVSDGCGEVESWCLFSREEEIALTTGAGAIVGAGIGAIYGIVTGLGRPARDRAPVTLVPATNGGVAVGLTLRH
jgi:hypothetical protein